MLHFAYGTNMSVASMGRRCPDAQLEGRACLPGYRFIIMRSGYASVVPAPGCGVHGLLWRVTPRDVAALNAYENLGGGLYRAVTWRWCRTAGIAPHWFILGATAYAGGRGPVTWTS